MDGRRFDDLVQTFAAGSRRRLLFTIAGGAVGALFSSATRAAVCRPPGRTCREHANCCSEICGPKDATGRRRCVCPPGLTACGDACVDLQIDAANCGACDLDCGALPHVSSVTCAASQCVIVACESGFEDCDQNVPSGCETPLGTDADCSACGDVCDPAAGEACVGGACEIVCVPSGGSCDQHGDCCNNWCEGTCVATPCSPVGDACDFHEDCCSRVCENNQVCVDCIPNGDPCTIVDHCCSKVCANGLCAAAACIGLGGSCITYNDDCCAGGSCVGTCL